LTTQYLDFHGTPAAEQCEIAVAERFSHLYSHIGQYNRRYIGGTTIWSQHAYANAIDIMVGLNNFAAGDVIYAFLAKNKEAFGIRTLLWRVTAHYDHIHVDFWPRGVYTPPLSSTGVATFRYSNGRQASARIQLITPEQTWDGDWMTREQILAELGITSWELDTLKRTNAGYTNARVSRDIIAPVVEQNVKLYRSKKKVDDLLSSGGSGGVSESKVRELINKARVAL
jgi:hypothetical protein